MALAGWLAASCAPVRTAGRDFPTAAFGTLRLRQTTDSQVEAVLGPPFKRLAVQGTTANPAGPVPPGTPFSLAILTYEFGISNGGPTVAGHPVGKFATLVFLGGTLAAYDLNSSIPGDANPPIDEQRLSLLKQGSTTRNDIIGLLGTPSGQSMALSFLPQDHGHVTYAWTHIDASGVRHKLLVIELDAHDVMIRYAMVDRSGPLLSQPGSVPLPIVVPKSAPLTTKS
jgi:hypothetical protein